MARLFRSKKGGARPDFHEEPVFSISHRLRRGAWSMCWLMLCRFSPVPLFAWRAAVLRLFGASIGEGTFIYPAVKIWAPWLLECEDMATIANGVEVYNPGGVRLGR